MFDIIVKEGYVVTDNKVEINDIAIKDGIIVDISQTINESAKETINAKGLYVFPGAYDSHVHFDEPGRTEWECFKTGSSALAAGGATVLADMPLNSIPFTLDKESFEIKNNVAKKSSYVDYTLWGGLIPDSIDKMEEMAEAGVIGFKAFTCFSGLDEYPGCDDYSLYRAMEKAAKIGLPISVHAENDSITRALWNKAVNENRVSARDFNESRPAITEIEAISRVLLFAEDTGCPIHIAHVSTARGVQLVEEARKKGVNASCETVPYYLVFTAEDVEKLGPMAKCGLPPKDQKNREDLWKMVISDKVDFVGSDHSPADVERKSGNNFFKIWGGIAGCQSTLETMLSDGCIDRGLSINKIPALTVGNVAERYSIKGKGKIEKGYDADITLVNMNKEYILKAEDLFYKNKTSPFVGHKFKVKVEQTILRGKTIYKNGVVVGEPSGRLIKPERL